MKKLFVFLVSAVFIAVMSLNINLGKNNSEIDVNFNSLKALADPDPCPCWQNGFRWGYGASGSGWWKDCWCGEHDTTAGDVCNPC